MKAQEVQIGERYWCTVNKRVVRIRIDGILFWKDPKAGYVPQAFNATSLETGKPIILESVDRLEGRVLGGQDGPRPRVKKADAFKILQQEEDPATAYDRQEEEASREDGHFSPRKHVPSMGVLEAEAR